jgi:hypothetical protein
MPALGDHQMRVRIVLVPVRVVAGVNGQRIGQRFIRGKLLGERVRQFDLVVRLQVARQREVGADIQTTIRALEQVGRIPVLARLVDPGRHVIGLRVLNGVALRVVVFLSAGDVRVRGAGACSTRARSRAEREVIEADGGTARRAARPDIVPTIPSTLLTPARGARQGVSKKRQSAPLAGSRRLPGPEATCGARRFQPRLPLRATTVALPLHQRVTVGGDVCPNPKKCAPGFNHSMNGSRGCAWRRTGARASHTARKRDTRRKILIGGAVLAAVEHEGVPMLQSRTELMGWLDAQLTREHDRAVFDLPPAPERAGTRHSAL